MHQIITFWIRLRGSLWFIPGLMLISAILLAIGLIELDSVIGNKWLNDFPRLFGLGADGARGMLTAIASSMLTVAALMFGLTLNTMTQASGQFTPRIFRNFMRDRSNQFALGYFISIFVYCLIVLRTIRSGDEIEFIPSIAVFVGLLLALFGVLVLIFIIHHIADSLQITSILKNIVHETKKAIEQTLPLEDVEATNLNDAIIFSQTNVDESWQKVPRLCSGYLQNINIEGLLKFAECNQLTLKMERVIGQFVGRGATLLTAKNNAMAENVIVVIDDEKIKSLNQLFSFDSHRTIEQDIDFGIRQIVDIALKALSPGINDTTTATICIDYIGEIMGEIARRHFPPNVVTAQNGGRVVMLNPDFQSMTETAFDQIRISGKANLAIFERLIETIAYVAECSVDKNYHTTLKQQVTLITEYARKTLETDYEKDKLMQKTISLKNSLQS